jgi:hypothetical protein
VRLDVNVGGPLPEREVDDFVQRPNDRVRLRQRGQTFTREIGMIKNAAAFELVQALFEVLLTRILDVNRVDDLAAKREHRTHRHLCNLPDSFHQFRVARRGHGHRQHAFDHVKSQHDRLLGHFGGQGLDGLVGDDRGERVDISDAEGIRPAATRVFAGHDLAVDDGVEQVQGDPMRLDELLQLVGGVELRQGLEPVEERRGGVLKHGVSLSSI